MKLLLMITWGLVGGTLSLMSGPYFGIQTGSVAVCFVAWILSLWVFAMGTVWIRRLPD